MSSFRSKSSTFSGQEITIKRATYHLDRKLDIWINVRHSHGLFLRKIIFILAKNFSERQFLLWKKFCCVSFWCYFTLLGFIFHLTYFHFMPRYFFDIFMLFTGIARFKHEFKNFTKYFQYKHENYVHSTLGR